jgi:hypothetical protein
MEKSDDLIKLLVDREAIKYKLEWSELFGVRVATVGTDCTHVTIVYRRMEINI